MNTELYDIVRSEKQNVNIAYVLLTYFSKEKEDEEEFLISKHHTLLQQLSEQQHELKRLENKQKELVQLKLQAEARLAAANETVSQTLQVYWICSLYPYL